MVYRVWWSGGWHDVKLGDRFTVFKVGSGVTCFGEGATLTKALTKHLVFTTDSGVEVKTKRENISHTIGKAKKSGYNVSLKPVSDFRDFILQSVHFWD